MVAPVSYRSLPSLVLLRNLPEIGSISFTRLSLSLVPDSAGFNYQTSFTLESYNPPTCVGVWAGPLSLVATDGILVNFFSFAYLDISVGQVPSRQRRVLIIANKGVSPFGHHRINASRQLPGVFRGLARPSSASSS